MIEPSSGVKKGGWCPFSLSRHKGESQESKVVKEALRVLEGHISPFHPSYLVHGHVDSKVFYMSRVDPDAFYCFSDRMDCSIDVWSVLQRAKEYESPVSPLPLLPQTCPLSIHGQSPYFVQAEEYYLFDPSRESINPPKGIKAPYLEGRAIYLVDKNTWQMKLQVVVNAAQQILQEGKQPRLKDFVEGAQQNLKSLQDFEKTLNEKVALTQTQEENAKDLAKVLISLLKKPVLAKSATAIRHLEQIGKIDQSKLVQVIARKVIEEQEDHLDLRHNKRITKEVLRSLPDA
ncbi:MAG: hypothetical protein ACSNEK_04455 [Parachlamydiaceae bacterium]